MSRENNIEVFEDTKKYFDKLSEEIKYSEKNTKIILENDVLDSIEGTNNLGIELIESKTFDAARKYGGHVAVLNFASATTPGGGVTKGAAAQEECLCRCSTLYPVISSEKCFNEFYKPHRENLNALHNDDIIWTPDVIVIKGDSYGPLPENRWKKISVITCAAPNLRDKNVDMFNIDKPLDIEISAKELFDIHVKRAKRIFQVADTMNVDVLVAGAFGCGAFKNNPQIVADAWKNATQKFRSVNLKKVVYAIWDNPYTFNYKTFEKVFNRTSDEDE